MLELRNLTDEAGVPRMSKFRKNCEVIDYYKSVFRQWDRDRDGYISISELKCLIATDEKVNLTKEALQMLFSRFDANNDELLDFDEFLIMLNHPTFTSNFKNIAQRYLKFVIIPRSRSTAVQLRRTATSTGEYEREIKCKKYTVGMLLISILQIIIHYVNYGMTDDDDLKDTDEVGPLGKLLRLDPCEKDETYRYITYMFIHNLHDNHFHLYFNVLFQLLVGIPLEMVHSWRLILVYFAGGIGGSLTHAAFTDHFTIGASGAAYSFTAAHMATVILNWREMSHPIVSIVLFSIIVVFNVGYEITMKHFLHSSSDDGTSYFSHLGGFLTGFFLGVIVLRNLKVTQREKIIWIVCFVMFFVMFSILIAMNVYPIHKCDD